MTCECGAKMRCPYSIPIGRKLRYRHYKCLVCGTREDTVEMPVELLGKEVEAIAALVKKGQARRFLGMKAKKKG